MDVGRAGTTRWVWGAALGVGALAALLIATPGLRDGPWGMVPGGALPGADRPCAEASWRAHARVEEWALEVSPERPRSVTTWWVLQDGEAFVPADFLTPFKQWPHRVMADPRVRVRLAGEVYRCRAERVRDTERIELLRRAAAAKYELDPEGWAARSEVWWFRIGPR